MKSESFIPFTPADKNIAETTAGAISLGLLIGLVMTAANTYLGLYAGMTVSASIPAAVLSMGILRGILKRGTILENNIVQTLASAGESLAAGIIFTIPALVLTGAWHGFHYWPVTLIAALGGLLGVLFMIPLRRALIIEEKELIYPEGLACAEVLEAGEKGGSGMMVVFASMGLGALFKVLISGIAIVRGTVEGAVRVGNSVFCFGSDMSPALLGVGFIVGPNVALLVFLGGAIAWLVGIPIHTAGHGIPEGISLVDHANDLWDTHIRYMGVGAMIVGGIWSIICVRKGIVKGLGGGFRGGTRTIDDKPLRTDRNIPVRQIALLLFLIIPFLFGLYIHLADSFSVGFLAGILMTVSSFFFVAVSSYIVGLVGSSNNPVSGMTICTVLFACVVMLLFGMSGTAGIIAVLGIAGVVCCAVCTAGDVSQDLKTGYLVGATPMKQQWVQVIGVIVPAFIIAPILTVLHSAYGIGDQLRAPQATLFANLTGTIFKGNGDLPWGMIVVGVAVGIGIILIDSVLRSRGSSFRTHIMPVAVGIYLPIALSTPILVGGLISFLVKHIVSGRGPGRAAGAQNRGLLFSSGLVAGEAVTGVILAGLIFLFEREILPGNVELPIELLDSSFVSVLLFVIITAVLTGIAITGKTSPDDNK